MQRVLEGIRVVEVAQWWFVPAAGAVLADWGAEVLKVEHPETGDPMRGLVSSGLVPAGQVNFMVEQPNRGKRGIGIDLAKPDGLEVLHKLVATADVFLTSFLPAARRKLKIDVEDIQRINPRIVYARGHGQGARGPDAERGGYDAASFWCRGSICDAITPANADAPIMQRAALGDSTGGLALAGGIAAALFRRERTGAGSVVDLSLLGTAMWLMAPDIIAGALAATAIPNFTRVDAPNPIVNSYRTKDGRWLFLNMLQPDRFWPDLCRRLGHPELIEDERFKDGMSRFMNRVECVSRLDEIFAQRTLAEWRAALADAEGVWAPMQKAGEIPADPQTSANGYMLSVEDADGSTFPLVANPLQFDQTPPTVTRAPDLGQHTEEILLEHGLSWDDIAKYKEAGAIS